jgi:hypothetical protein
MALAAGAHLIDLEAAAVALDGHALAARSCPGGPGRGSRRLARRGGGGARLQCTLGGAALRRLRLPGARQWRPARWGLHPARHSRLRNVHRQPCMASAADRGPQPLPVCIRQERTGGALSPFKGNKSNTLAREGLCNKSLRTNRAKTKPTKVWADHCQGRQCPQGHWRGV